MSSDFESLSCDEELTPPRQLNARHHASSRYASGLHIPPSRSRNRHDGDRESLPDDDDFDYLDDLVAAQDARLLRRLPLGRQRANHRHLHHGSLEENDDDSEGSQGDGVGGGNARGGSGSDSSEEYGHRQFGVTGPPRAPGTAATGRQSLLQRLSWPGTPAPGPASLPPPSSSHHHQQQQQRQEGAGSAQTHTSRKKAAGAVEDASAPSKGDQRHAKRVQLFTQPKADPELPPPPPQQQQQQEPQMHPQRQPTATRTAATSHLRPAVLLSPAPVLYPPQLLAQEYEAADVNEGSRYRTAGDVESGSPHAAATHQEGELVGKNEQESEREETAPRLPVSSSSSSHPSKAWKATCPPDSGQITPTTSAATLSPTPTLASVEPARDGHGVHTPAQPSSTARTRDTTAATTTTTTTTNTMKNSTSSSVAASAVPARAAQQQQQQLHDRDGFYRTGLLEESSEDEEETDTHHNESTGNADDQLEKGDDGSGCRSGAGNSGDRHQRHRTPVSAGGHSNDAAADDDNATAAAAGEAPGNDTACPSQPPSSLCSSTLTQPPPLRQIAAASASTAAPSRAAAAASSGVVGMAVAGEAEADSAPPPPSTLSPMSSVAALRAELTTAAVSLRERTRALPPLTAVHTLSLIITALLPLNVLCLDVMLFVWIRQRVDVPYRQKYLQLRGGEVSDGFLRCHSTARDGVATAHNGSGGGGRHGRSFFPSSAQTGASACFKTHPAYDSASNTSTGSLSTRLANETRSSSGSGGGGGEEASHTVPLLCSIVLWLMVPNGLLCRLLLLRFSNASTSTPSVADKDDAGMPKERSSAASDKARSAVLNTEEAGEDSLSPHAVALSREKETTLLWTEMQAYAAMYRQLCDTWPQLQQLQLYLTYLCTWLVVNGIAPLLLCPLELCTSLFIKS